MVPRSKSRLKIVIPACEPLLLTYCTTSEQLRTPATSLWRSVTGDTSYGPRGAEGGLTPAAGARQGVAAVSRDSRIESFGPRTTKDTYMGAYVRTLRVTVSKQPHVG